MPLPGRNRSRLIASCVGVVYRVSSSYDGLFPVGQSVGKDDGFGFDAVRNATHTAFVAVLENQGYGASQVGTAFFFGLVLAVGPGDFQAISDVPAVALFMNYSEFVMYCSTSTGSIYPYSNPNVSKEQCLCEGPDIGRICPFPSFTL